MSQSQDNGRHADIDIEALKELVDLMDENGLRELEYEMGDFAVRLSKGAAAPVASDPVATASAAPVLPAAQPIAGGETSEDDGYEAITSPMVGTFYASASADTETFVSRGSDVGGDTVVCLIEAMKVFNEIKAETSGRIAKVCVENEATVEFGQTLFLIEPN
jgi:acetyl-CoA carboxylase biotin carboxyl carrier protein